ncbi:unnamed protein product, partial [marine sediment metagenome]
EHFSKDARLFKEDQNEVNNIRFALNSNVRSLYNLSNRNRGNDEGEIFSVSVEKNELYKNKQELINYLIGIQFGRWDIRLALNPSLAPKHEKPDDPLPICPPGMLINPKGFPATSGNIVSETWLNQPRNTLTIPSINEQGQAIDYEGKIYRTTVPDSEYPIGVQWDGVVVDDPGVDERTLHQADIVRKLREVLAILWPENHSDIEGEACEILGVKDLREYFRNPSYFFADHLRRYSKSRRKAPIYWPLSTSSGSYTLWLYYHRLDDEILYTAVNRYVDPKISHVERSLNRMKVEISNTTGQQARDLREAIEQNQNFLVELRTFREELLRIAQLPFKPNLNDGVIINAAPFHNLFGLSKWVKDTKAVWDKLEAGEYDWSHMAYTIWPKRVREVCKKDKS